MHGQELGRARVSQDPLQGLRLAVLSCLCCLGNTHLQPPNLLPRKLRRLICSRRTSCRENYADSFAPQYTKLYLSRSYGWCGMDRRSVRMLARRAAGPGRIARAVPGAHRRPGPAYGGGDSVASIPEHGRHYRLGVAIGIAPDVPHFPGTSLDLPEPV